MHNRDKYPAIWAEFEAAQAALAPLMEARKVHTDAMKDVQIEIQALKDKKVELNDKAMADISQIHELQDTISRLAKAMGAKTASGR